MPKKRSLPNRRTLAFQAAFGVAISVAACAAQFLLWHWLAPRSFVLFYPAVIIASIVGGMASGFFAILSSALAANYFFTSVHPGFRIPDSSGLIQLSVFVASAVAVAWISEKMQRQTRRLEAALALQSSEREKLRLIEALIENSPSAIIVVDHQGMLFRVNRKAEELFGYKRNELLGRPIELLVPERYQTHHPALRDNYLKAPTPRPLGVGRDLYARGKSGADIPVEISLSPLNTEQGQFVLATIIDITERKKAEKAIANALSDSKEALQARDEFISIVSHELKTPLTSLKLQNQLRRRFLSQDEDATYPHSELIHIFESDDRQLNRLARMVEDMLDVSRINIRRLGVEKETFDLTELAREVTNRYSPECRQKGISISLHATEAIQGVWDRTRIDQVLSNLITNAIKYGNRTPIDVVVSRTGNSAEFRVTDRGKGIPKEDQERIFRRFERGVPPGTVSGLGLGLYIARNLIELHGGTIRVESEPGRGATFTVILPLV